MRITADSNVYLAALFFQGKSRELLHRAIDADFALALSIPIYEEIQSVARRKLDMPTDASRAMRRLLFESAVVYATPSFVDIIEEDPRDNRVLECAIDSQSNYIVSADPHLLALREFRGIPILTAPTFLRRFA